MVHISGPGCPACVTHESEVDAFIDLAGCEGVILVTFGHVLRASTRGGLATNLNEIAEQ